MRGYRCVISAMRRGNINTRKIERFVNGIMSHVRRGGVVHELYTDGGVFGGDSVWICYCVYDWIRVACVVGYGVLRELS